jgi:probable phosphoglycerate mutase
VPKKIAAVYASPLGRTVETARILAAPHNLRANMRRIPGNLARSLGRDEAARSGRKISGGNGRMGKGPIHICPGGGESGLAVTARALPALIDLVREHPGENILVVSHKATIRLLLSSLLGFDPRRYRDNLDQKPAAAEYRRFSRSDTRSIDPFNDTSHYDKTAIPEIPKASLSKWWNASA